MDKNKVKGIIGYVIISLLSISVIWDIIQYPKHIIDIIIIFLAVCCGKMIGKWIKNINKKDEDNDKAI